MTLLTNYLLTFEFYSNITKLIGDLFVMRQLDSYLSEGYKHCVKCKQFRTEFELVSVYPFPMTERERCLSPPFKGGNTSTEREGYYVENYTFFRCCIISLPIEKTSVLRPELVHLLQSSRETKNFLLLSRSVRLSVSGACIEPLKGLHLILTVVWPMK